MSSGSPSADISGCGRTNCSRRGGTGNSIVRGRTGCCRTRITGRSKLSESKSTGDCFVPTLPTYLDHTFSFPPPPPPPPFHRFPNSLTLNIVACQYAPHRQRRPDHQDPRQKRRTGSGSSSYQPQQPPVLRDIHDSWLRHGKEGRPGHHVRGLDAGGVQLRRGASPPQPRHGRALHRPRHAGGRPLQLVE